MLSILWYIVWPLTKSVTCQQVGHQQQHAKCCGMTNVITNGILKCILQFQCGAGLLVYSVFLEKPSNGNAGEESGNN